MGSADEGGDCSPEGQDEGVKAGSLGRGDFVIARKRRTDKSQCGDCPEGKRASRTAVFAAEIKTEKERDAVTTLVSPALSEQAAQRQGKYLVFHLDREEFGVHVLKVREIMGLQEITAVPRTPDYVKGVINLRGKVIPVVDLRRKFQLQAAEYTARTCIVVLQVRVESGPMQMGVIVDGVSEVLTIQEDEIENTPDFGDQMKLPYILGMAKVKGKVKILLDIDRVLAQQEIAGLDLLRVHAAE